ncbi:MAG: hypothetical protein SAMD01599839_00320 [Rectinema sp.]
MYKGLKARAKIHSKLGHVIDTVSQRIIVPRNTPAISMDSGVKPSGAGIYLNPKMHSTAITEKTRLTFFIYHLSPK